MKKLLTALLTSLCATVFAQDESLSFYANYDDTAKATFAKGQAAPAEEKDLDFVPGFKGQAVRVNGFLSYEAKGNYSKERGTLSMWIKPLRPAPAEKPLFMQRLFTDGVMKHLKGFGLGYVNEIYLWTGIDNDVYRGSEIHGWEQVVITWDSDGKDGQGSFRFYIAGKTLPAAEVYMGDIYRLKAKFDPATGPLFYIGCEPGGAQAKYVAIDELKIYNRVLPPETVWKNYLDTTPLHFLPRPQILPDGKKCEVQVNATNRSEKTVSAQLVWSFRTADGKQIASGEWGDLSLKTGAKTTLPLELEATASGLHELAILDKSTGREQVYPLYVPPVEKLSKIEGDAPLSLEHLETIDCAGKLPAGKFGANDYQIVKSPAGSYCEGSRIAFEIDVEKINQPYLLTVTYPDDAERTVTIHVSTEFPRGQASHLQNGYYTGKPAAITGKMISSQYLWWPETKRTALVFIDRQGTKKAAVASISVDLIKGNVPALKINAPEKEPGREIGMDFEDASLGCNFGLGFGKFSPTQNDYDILCKRMGVYMAYSGMNALTYPVTWYGGPNWGNSKSCAVSNRKNDHPDLWLEILLSDFKKDNLKFYPSVNMDHDSFLFTQAYAGSDERKVKAGVDTIIFVNNDGTLAKTWNCRPVYNPLHPTVRQHLLDLVEEMVERCENSPSFGGVNLWLGRENFLFKGTKCGYDDMTVNLFEKETGIQIPVDRKSENRFYLRYRFLLTKHRQEWLQWRADKLTTLYAEMLAVIQRNNKEAKLVLDLENSSDVNDEIINGKVDLLDAWLTRGIDVKRLSKMDGIVLQRVERSDSYRWYLPENGGVEHLERFRAEASANFYDKYFSGVRFFEEYYEPRLSLCDPKKNPLWKPIKDFPLANNIVYYGPCQGRGRAYLMEMAWTMALTDPLYFSRGGITEEGQGHLEEFQEFAAAYRALPAAKFSSWSKGMTEPVFVREYEGKAGHYFYLVNTLETDATARLGIKQGAGVLSLLFGSSSVKDLSSGELLKETDGTYEIKLKPYQLRSFLAPSGSEIATVETSLPKETLDDLKEQANTLCNAFEANKAKLSQKTMETYAARVAAVKAALANKAYFQLHRLLHDGIGEAMQKLSANRCWLVAGPFDNAAKNKIDVPYPPEEKLDFNAAMPSGDGKSIVWQKVIDFKQGIDFAKLFPHQDWKTTYAFIKFKAPETRKATLLLGSDDGAKIWLNGQEVFKLDVKRGASKWDNAIPVTLKQGENTLLVKIDNKDGGWLFYLDFADEKGKSLTNLEY